MRALVYVEGPSDKGGVGGAPSSGDRGGESTRFKVHCLQHDLEALVLASVEALRQRLGTKDRLENLWRRPVELQNDERPPKRVVMDLFSRYGKKKGYRENLDAPWILERSSLDTVVERCNLRFAPFVNELRAFARA